MTDNPAINDKTTETTNKINTKEAIAKKDKDNDNDNDNDNDKETNAKYHPILKQMLQNTETLTENNPVSTTVSTQPRLSQEEEKEDQELNDSDFTFNTEYNVNPRYYSVINNIFSSAIRTELKFVIIGAIGVLIAILIQQVQSVRGSIFYNIFYVFSVIFFLVLVISVILFAMDSYYRRFVMIKFKFVLEKNGIAVFPIESFPEEQPVSFIPYSLIQDVEKVNLGHYLLKPRGFNPTLKKISRSEIAGIDGVLVKYRLDKHFEKYPERKQELVQKSLFFQAPPGSTLYIVDQATTFMKSVKKARRVFRK